MLRLLKLMRLFRASRIVKRWESRISITYSILVREPPPRFRRPQPDAALRVRDSFWLFDVG